MDQSFAERFTDVERSLTLAETACTTADAVVGAAYLDQESVNDLLADARLHLGNALRLNSDSRSAETALEQAETLIDLGTRDRTLRAKLHSFRASLRIRQRRASDAVIELDKEIALRKLLNDTQGEATALVNRGTLSCHSGDLKKGCEYLRRGTLLTEDPELTHIGLLNLAAGLARCGRGLEAWTVLSRVELISPLPEKSVLVTLLRWTKALIYFSFEQHSRAERELRAVRRELIKQERRHLARSAAIDLASVLATRGSHEEVAALASEAHQMFAAECLDRRVLEVLRHLRNAANAKTLTADFAARVANFVARSRYDRDVEFEHPVP